MNRIFTIMIKDLIELLREWQTFLFMLLIPVIFTVLFGLAFGSAYNPVEDPRLPVALVDQDGGALAASFKEMLVDSEILRVEEKSDITILDLEKQVADNQLAGLVIIPGDYGEKINHNQTSPVEVITAPGSSAGATVAGEIMASAGRLANIVRAAYIVSSTVRNLPFSQALENLMAAWQTPPIQIQRENAAVELKNSYSISMSQSSPAMMLMFAIAGMLNAGQMMVTERKSRSLQRMLTTAASRLHILLGHYIAILVLILLQFILLVAFGQIILKVEYLRVPAGTLVVIVASAACISALGLLIGVLARSDEQAVVFSLIPMFVFSMLGGAWMPLEYTAPSFRAVGHISPIAWAMDGFKNIAVRGLGFESILLPSAMLLGYEVFFFILAVWRFYRMQEK